MKGGEIIYDIGRFFRKKFPCEFRSILCVAIFRVGVKQFSVLNQSRQPAKKFSKRVFFFAFLAPFARNPLVFSPP